jgi:hypothetical protein
MCCTLCELLPTVFKEGAGNGIVWLTDVCHLSQTYSLCIEIPAGAVWGTTFWVPYFWSLVWRLLLYTLSFNPLGPELKCRVNSAEAGSVIDYHYLHVLSNVFILLGHFSCTLCLDCSWLLSPGVNMPPEVKKADVQIWLMRRPQSLAYYSVAKLRLLKTHQIFCTVSCCKKAKICCDDETGVQKEVSGCV